MYPINSLLGLCRKIVLAVISHISYGIMLTVLNKQYFNVCCCLFCLFVGFVALHPKSTAMVIAGRSVHLTTLFPGQA